MSGGYLEHIFIVSLALIYSVASRLEQHNKCSPTQPSRVPAIKEHYTAILTLFIDYAYK